MKMNSIWILVLATYLMSASNSLTHVDCQVPTHMYACNFACMCSFTIEMLVAHTVLATAAGNTKGQKAEGRVEGITRGHQSPDLIF